MILSDVFCWESCRNSFANSFWYSWGTFSRIFLLGILSEIPTGNSPGILMRICPGCCPRIPLADFASMNFCRIFFLCSYMNISLYCIGIFSNSTSNSCWQCSWNKSQNSPSNFCKKLVQIFSQNFFEEFLPWISPGIYPEILSGICADMFVGILPMIVLGIRGRGISSEIATGIRILSNMNF